jgi:nitrile hydratase accessory protein
VSAIDRNAVAQAALEMPGLPQGEDGPVFREPWEAQAFAMALSLHQRGVFTWPEWAATLADEIKRAQEAGDPDTGETYYHHWLNALERLVAKKGQIMGVLQPLVPGLGIHEASDGDLPWMAGPSPATNDFWLMQARE